MNNKLNIREIIERYKVKNLYSPLCGECTYNPSPLDSRVTVKLKSRPGCLDFYADGRYLSASDIPLLFPSRELYEKYPLNAKMAWEEWIDENTERIIKTWEDIEADRENYGGTSECITNIESEVLFSIAFGDTLTKSAIALLKIRKLIDVAYGGNPTTDDKLKGAYWFIAIRRTENGTKPTGYGVADPIDVYYSMYAERASECIDPIAFYTKEQAEEFISHESNCQLIRDFYMV